MKKAKRSIKPKELAELFRTFSELEAFARKGGLSLDAIMILLWLQKEQRSTVGYLSSSLGLSPSKTTRCLKELRALGLVDESLDSEDLRKCHVRISGKGVNVVYEVVGEFGEETIVNHIKHFADLKHAALTAEQTSGHKITSTAQSLLMTLYVAKKPMTVGQLSLATSLPQPRVSMSLKALRDAGLIESAAQSESQREFQLEPQPEPPANPPSKPQKSDQRSRSMCLSKEGFDLSAIMMLMFVL